MMADDSSVKQWTDLVAKQEQLKEYQVKQQGSTNKDDGYLSTIIFLTISGISNDGHKKNLDIVINSVKIGDDNYRKNFPIDKIFGREIMVYCELQPLFEDFAEENQVFLTNIMPKCYLSQLTDGREGLVMENLKSAGFGLWDRKVVMTPKYTEMVLRGFAQWHAYSFALKSKKPEVFKKITENYTNMFPDMFERQNMYQYLFDMFLKAKSTVTSSKIWEKVDFNLSDIKFAVSDLPKEDQEDHVIIHGDCWTNNYMFKLDSNGNPNDIRFIDWQFSSSASPICDISFFIFCCANLENPKTLGNLLKFYHKTLSGFLQQFGCDQEKIFSFDRMMKHWKKFSLYGFIVSNFILRFSLCDADEAPDFAEELAKGRPFLDIFYFDLKNEDYYLKRVGDNLRSYVEFA